MRYCSRDPAAERRRFWSLPPPALGERSHGGLAALGIAVRWQAALYQGPHPGASYGRGVGVEDAADNFAVGEHVEIVVIPFPGGAAGRCTFEDEVILLHRTNLKASETVEYPCSRVANRTDSDPRRGRMVLFGPSKAGPPTLSPPCVWRRRKRGARSRVLPPRGARHYRQSHFEGLEA